MNPHKLFDANTRLAYKLAGQFYQSHRRRYPLADLEDFQNTALLGLWRACLRYRGGSFSTYAYRIICGHLFMSRRTLHPLGKAAQHTEETTKQWAGPRIGAYQDSLSAPDTSVEDAEEVRHLLGLLRPRDREILWLCEAEGLSFKEIGERFGISDEMARRVARRALAKLRKVAT